MRIYTLVFSVVAHAIAIAWVIIAPALATDVLPEPQRTSAYIVVHPATPEVPPAIRRPASTPSRNAAPTSRSPRFGPSRTSSRPDQPPSTYRDRRSTVSPRSATSQARVIQAPPHRSHRARSSRYRSAASFDRRRKCRRGARLSNDRTAGAQTGARHPAGGDR